MSTRTPRGAAQGCAGIRNLADHAGVRLTTEHVRSGSRATGTEDAGAADSRRILRGRVDLRDDIAEVEEPATHGVEFRVDQFNLLNHDFSPQGLHVINIRLEASQCLTARVDTGGWFFYL